MEGNEVLGAVPGSSRTALQLLDEQGDSMAYIDTGGTWVQWCSHVALPAADGSQFHATNHKWHDDAMLACLGQLDISPESRARIDTVSINGNRLRKLFPFLPLFPNVSRALL